MATTRADMEAGDELQQLKALVAEQQQRLDALEGHKDSPNGGETKEQRSTRRQILRLAGATLVGAAGAAALRAIPAAAADGDPVITGSNTIETLGFGTGIRQFPPGTGAVALYGSTGPSSVGVEGTATSYGTGVFGYVSYQGIGVEGTVINYGTGVRGNAALGGIGVLGSASSTKGDGVLGQGATGVFGQGTGSAGYGVFATAPGGTGVFGSGHTGISATTVATGSRALYAYSAATGSVAIQASQTNPGGLFTGGASAVTGYSKGDTAIVGYGYVGGVWGQSGSTYSAGVIASGHSNGTLIGPDLKLFGSGRMVQVANVTGGVGAPNFTPLAGYFEMVRARDGAMWINRGTGTLKASWKRINAVRVDAADGTGAPYAPFRLYDSRKVGGRKAAGSTTVVQVAGAGLLTSAIPADAVAIIGNLTAAAYTGSGFLAISPAGVSVVTSSVNFITGQAAIANSFIVGLGTGTNAGQVQVKVAGHSSHIVIDVTGYLQ